MLVLVELKRTFGGHRPAHSGGEPCETKGESVCHFPEEWELATLISVWGSHWGLLLTSLGPWCWLSAIPRSLTCFSDGPELFPWRHGGHELSKDWDATKEGLWFINSLCSDVYWFLCIEIIIQCPKNAPRECKPPPTQLNSLQPKQ